MTSKRPNVRASRQGLVRWENCCVSLAQSETCCSLQQFLYVHDRMSGVRSCLSDPVKFKFLVWWPVCWVHVYRYTAKLSKDDLCGVEGLRGRAVGGQADRQGGPAREEEGCSWPAAGQATCGALRSRRNGGKHSHPVPTMLIQGIVGYLDCVGHRYCNNRNTVEPFAAMFWALGIVCTCQHLILPAGPASLYRRTQSMSLYGHSWFNSQRRCVASPPPLCQSRYVIYLCCTRW